MKVRKTLRIPIGFASGIIYLLCAQPNLKSFCAGALLMFCGEAIRFISAGTLIKYEGVTCNGIYAYSRNPLYLGSFLIGVGACVLGRDLIFSVFFIIAFPVIYFQIIKREEKYLLNRYGEDYERYTREVPRFWSWRVSIDEIIRESSLFLAVKNQELKTVVGIVAVLVVMLVKMIY